MVGYTATVGDEVRYHSYAWGWRFGKVIAVREHDGCQWATVQFHKRQAGWPDVAELPSFRMDRIASTPCNCGSAACAAMPGHCGAYKA